MDGNGRWAQRGTCRGLRDIAKGTQTARTTIETCARLKIEALTLYAFSVENWRRPKAEIDFLMQLLREYLRTGNAADPAKQYSHADFWDGARSFQPACKQDMREAIEKTAGNTRHGAVHGAELRRPRGDRGRGQRYCSRNAVRKEARSPKTAGRAIICSGLYTTGLPDPDLMIRTSGEMRVSNFLLWQIAYAEIFVTETLWPDFNRARLLEASWNFRSGAALRRHPRRWRRSGNARARGRRMMGRFAD